MDLVNEWPYGTAEEKKGAALLLKEARKLSLETLDREFHHLFVGPNDLEAPPWGSVYLDSEAVVFGDSCMSLVRWMKENGIARVFVSISHERGHAVAMAVAEKNDIPS